MFVLICGCPRSGTTELTNFLNRHSDIYLGCERYLYRYRNADEPVTLADFSPERFSDLRAQDTFWPSLEKMPGWAENGPAKVGREKIGKTKIFGDKAPFAIFKLNEIVPRFLPDCKVIVCIRDIISVGRSWQARADNVSDTLWERTAGFEESLQSWTGAIGDLFSAQAKGLPVEDVFVPDLFRDDRTEITRVMEAIGLDFDADLNAAFDAQLKGNADPRKARSAHAKVPTPEEEATVLSNRFVKYTVGKIKVSKYRISLDRLFWDGFQQKFETTYP